MIRDAGQVGLYLDGALRPWSTRGYGAPRRLVAPGAVDLLTPPAIVASIAAGYRPLLHPTAVPGGPPPGCRAHPGLPGS